MDLKNLQKIPKNYFKEILKALSKLEKIKRIPFFSGIHFKDAEKDLIQKIEDYKKVEREANKIWKIIELSRNEGRPRTMDYIEGIFEDFVELKGDRLGSDDKSIVCGLGRIDGKTIAVIGHNKGRDIKERIEYNFGMSYPGGYRKSQRVMRLADKFGFPIITFIDTPGAYPDIEAEDEGQASAIANSILTMFEVKVPIISILIGEGGSGGALAIAAANYLMMLENSTYSVISPEGCAAILWKDPQGAKLAARALKLTSKNLAKLKVIDRIIHEPIGGAQKDPKRMIRIVKNFILDVLRLYKDASPDEIKKEREEKYQSMGFFSG